MKLVLVLVVIAGCVFGQSDHCGDEFTRNMTHVKAGLYRVEGGTIAGSQQLRLEMVGDNLVVTTDDGRSAHYRVR